MSKGNRAIAVAALVFLAVLIVGNIMVRTPFAGHYIPDPYSFAVVFAPPFPAAVVAYKLALLRRRPQPAA